MPAAYLLRSRGSSAIAGDKYSDAARAADEGSASAVARAIDLRGARHGPSLMPRNFGVRGGPVRDFWHERAGDEPESRWPFFVIGAAVVLIVLFGIFVA
jgi:hypothetical protein